METLTYAPWVAQKGMAGTFEHLVKAWGSPDSWPNVAVREQVCERGRPVPWVADRYAPTLVRWISDAPEHPNYRDQYQRVGDETA